MEKISSESLNIIEKNINKLKELFPNVVIEGKIDFDKLRIILGGEIEDSVEKYQFNWVGKSNTIKNVLTPSICTLIPNKENSLNWDNTKNLYIEGDNLETLKLLQKTYYEKIKVIYIDPPYNTGHDFVYNDDFSNSIENYKKITSQTNRANPDTNGRFHTDWLNMMYSRLCLARNLLKDNGVIFISIDDNEQANLKKICDEIFGENNFVSSIIWRRKTGSSDAKCIATITEYILVYAKNITEASNGTFAIDKTAYDVNRFKLEDIYVQERGKHYLDNLDRGSLGYVESLDFGIETPDGTLAFPNGRTKKFNDGWRWTWGKEKVEWGLKNGFIEFRKAPNTECGWKVVRKNYLLVDNDGKPFIKGSPYKNLITDILNTQATLDLQKLLGGKYFDYSKPVELIKLLLQYINLNNDIILDFFSGSSTTGQAIMELNAEFNSNNSFILVQLPEICDDKSEAFKAGYKNICEIGKERIRRSGQKIYNELKEKYENAGLLVEDCVNPETLDFGFKVFKLESTNIRPWDGSHKVDEQTIFDFTDTIKEDRTNFDVAYEIMLKYGIFNMPLKEVSINNKTMYNIGEGYMIICLDDDITSKDVMKIANLKPHCVVFKEQGFADDNEKINATYTLERLGVEDVKCI